jgi:hypothetical protein
VSAGRRLDLSRDVTEQRVQVHPEQCRANDNGECDQLGDEAIFDCGYASLRFNREPARHDSRYLTHDDLPSANSSS